MVVLPGGNAAVVHPFLRKLRHGARLSNEDEDALASLARIEQRVGAHGEIMGEGVEPRSMPLILEGWACRYRVLENGKRQITSLFVPGDLCQPFGTLPRFMDHSLGALTPVVLAPVSPKAIRAAVLASPRIEEALWWDLLVASAIEREHVVSLGRRSAPERLGHLVCELHSRLAVVGLVDRLGFDLPLTQADLGDLLGLSTVHVNRSLQELRKSGLISSRGRRLTIHDLQRLEEFSFFDAAFLHPESSASR